MKAAKIAHWKWTGRCAAYIEGRGMLEKIPLPPSCEPVFIFAIVRLLLLQRKKS
jgi:hypothetical protein